MSYRKDILNSQKDLKIINQNNSEIIVKAKYGPSKPTSIPFILNEDMAFLTAAIIGDGHLKKNKLQISFEVQDKKLVEQLINICHINFDRKFNIKSRTRKEKDYYNFVIDSKAIYNLLNIVFEIPNGRKSHIVKVPDYIKSSNRKIKLAFLAGIMATEGGRRKRGYGLSTASIILWKDLIQTFKDIGIRVKEDKWVHKKYKKEYYGICFNREENSILQAGIPKRSNGTGLGDSLHR